jgi:hypothetical protein
LEIALFGKIGKAVSRLGFGGAVAASGTTCMNMIPMRMKASK